MIERQKQQQKCRHKHMGLFITVLFALLIFFSDPAFSQALTLNLGDQSGSATAKIIQLILIVTVLSIAPSLLLMVTSFTRIVIVLSFLRQSMGTQQTPPNQVLISLALFLSIFIMMPTQKLPLDGYLKRQNKMKLGLNFYSASYTTKDTVSREIMKKQWHFAARLPRKILPAPSSN